MWYRPYRPDPVAIDEILREGAVAEVREGGETHYFYSFEELYDYRVERRLRFDDLAEKQRLERDTKRHLAERAEGGRLERKRLEVERLEAKRLETEALEVEREAKRKADEYEQNLKIPIKPNEEERVMITVAGCVRNKDGKWILKFHASETERLNAGIGYYRNKDGRFQKYDLT